MAQLILNKDTAMSLRLLFAPLLALALAVASPLAAATPPLKKLTLAGPAAGVSNGLIHLVASNGLAEIGRAHV